MISTYVNQDDLLANQPPVRYNSSDLELLELDTYALTINSGSPAVELHVYNPTGGYVTGDHNIPAEVLTNNQTKTALTAPSLFTVDTKSVLERLNIIRGQYRLFINFHVNVLGSYDGDKLWISEISTSRTEIALKFTNSKSKNLTDQYNLLKLVWSAVSLDTPAPVFLLNLGFNQTYQCINFSFEVDSLGDSIIYVKLLTPLNESVSEKDKAWICQELIDSFQSYTIVVPKEVSPEFKSIAAPNFSIEVDRRKNVTTDYKTWTDLLSSNPTTSQKLVDSYFSGSLEGIDINIDYSVFDNFVHYGSAYDRVENFKYKIELLESYNNRLETLYSIPNATSSLASLQNIREVNNLRNNLYGTFDSFEMYLYGDGSSIATYTHYDPTLGTYTRERIQPIPKNDDAVPSWETLPYLRTFVSSTSVEFETYFQNLLSVAQDFDSQNPHSLYKSIPQHLTEDNEVQFTLFVNMLGQHFDIIWSYVKAIKNIHTREEHPNDGVSDELLYSIAKSYGFELLNGRSSSDLWSYSFGTNVSGSLQSTGSLESRPLEKNNTEVWRRIVNNLPYILKNKGSERSIRALASCFGIPNSFLTIREYGGPSTFTEDDHFPEYNKRTYYKAFNTDRGLLGINTGLIRYYEPNSNSWVSYKCLVPYKGISLRFKPSQSQEYIPDSYYAIFTHGNGQNGLYLYKGGDESGNIDRLVYYGEAGNFIVLNCDDGLFDDNWKTVHVFYDYSDVDAAPQWGSCSNITAYPSGTLSKHISCVSVNQYGKVVGSFQKNETSTVSGESKDDDDGTITFGIPGTTNSFSAEKLSCHVSELRFWKTKVDLENLIEHSLSPRTYTLGRNNDNLADGSFASIPYDNLLARYPLSTYPTGSTGPGSISTGSIHPNQRTYSIPPVNASNSVEWSVEGTGDYDGAPFESLFSSFEETTYTPSPSLGNNSLYTDKVRLATNEIVPGKTLNTKTRSTRSSEDLYSIDSNRVGIFFSPQTLINEDIFHQLGYFEIDDYIGNPVDEYDTEYTDYVNFGINYWKKFLNRNDMEAYMRLLSQYDFTLFKYIKKLLPHRANPILGLYIEPNVLERSKQKVMNKPTSTNATKKTVISARFENPTTGKYIYTTGSISKRENVVQGYTTQYTGSIDMYTETVNLTGNAWSENRYLPSGVFDTNRVFNPITIVYNNVHSPENVLNSLQQFSAYNVQRSEIFERLYDQNLSVVTSPASPAPGNPPNQPIRFRSLMQSFITSGYEDYVNFLAEFYTGFVSNQPGLSLSVSINDYINANRSFIQTLLNTPSRTYASFVSYKKVTPYGTGYEMSRFIGAQIVGADINVDSPDTIDGGPVIRVRKVNPNNIVIQNNKPTTTNVVRGNLPDSI